MDSGRVMAAKSRSLTKRATRLATVRRDPATACPDASPNMVDRVDS